MCLNPIAWYIRSTEGYSIPKDKNRKLTHNLWTLLGVTEMRSCAHKERKNNATFRASAYSGDNILVLGEDDYYKFLGKFENSIQLEGKVSELASEEFVRRLHIIWSSPLAVPHKVKATNCFAIPVLQYHM